MLIVGAGSGAQGARPVLRLGHFAAERWLLAADDATAPEVLIGGEGLARGAGPVLATLLHEAAHALASARGVPETSRRGQYHNRRFRALAEELGLQVDYDPRIGWSPTTLPAATAAVYAAEITAIQAAITAVRRHEPSRAATADRAPRRWRPAHARGASAWRHRCSPPARSCAPSATSHSSSPSSTPRTPRPRRRRPGSLKDASPEASLILGLRAVPQPVIAAVNGPAAGFGLALSLGCDIRYASHEALFRAAFINVGVSNCDMGTSWLLPRLIGASRAHELMLTGRKVDAEEALRIGLVADVVDSESLAARALEGAAQIASLAPWGVRLTKRGMWTALEIPSQEAAVEYEDRQQTWARSGTRCTKRSQRSSRSDRRSSPTSRVLLSRARAASRCPGRRRCRA